MTRTLAMARSASLPEEVSPLTLRLLGPFEARLGEEPLPRLRSRKGPWLLALLALRDGAEVERSWLAGTLWPDSSERDAYASLRKSLADLRAALGEAAGRLQSPTSHSLRLHLSGADVDVREFDAAIRRGDAEALERAAALYRGPLLEGCDQEWVVAERQARETACLEALERLAAGAIAGGDPRAADGYLRQVVALDPLRESAQRALMQALAESGSYAAATLVYRELRLLLHRELNVQPDPETTALFDRIRAEARQRARARAGGAGPEEGKAGGSAGSAPALASGAPLVPFSLRVPHPLSGLVGREREVQEIARCLGRARLVTLTGAGGVGKTRLAIRVAEEVVEEYSDGAWFVDLAPVWDPSLVPQTAAAALGVRPETHASVMEALVSFLRPKELLLVLDNCEHLLAAGAGLAHALLAGCPRLRLLATSRQSLGITGEVDWRVPSLSLPDAAQLFLQRTGAARPGFALAAEDGAAVAEVCRRLDGIPLAIELAAARLKALAIGEIAARLDDRFRLLTGGSRTVLPRQQTLRATMDWSYNLLSTAEQALLRRLSVFAGGWTLEAAEAVCGEEWTNGREEERKSPNRPAASTPPLVHASTPSPEVLDLLTSLVDKSLVIAEEEGGRTRYRLLETVRQYAAERLEEASETGRAGERHWEFFLALGRRAPAELLEAEHDNLRAAWRWANSQEASPEGHLDLARHLRWFWTARGFLGEGRACLEEALARSREAPALARAQALDDAGGLAHLQGDYQRATELRAESLELYRRLRDPVKVGLVMISEGNTRFMQADYEAAAQLYEEGLSLSRKTGNAYGIADALRGLGNIAVVRGDYPRATAVLEESLELFRKVDYPHGVATLLAYLGELAMLRGDQARATRLLEESLGLARAGANRRAVAFALDLLGQLAHRQRDDDRAEVLLTESLALHSEMGQRSGVAGTLLSLGQVARQRGSLPLARSRYADSLRTAAGLGEKWRIAGCLEGLAAVAAIEGHPERAARLFGAAEALREAVGVPLPPAAGEERGPNTVSARQALGHAALAAAWVEGRAMILEAAIAYALEAAAAA
jgi:predicted ATPase/DNA-binding SARP family transcriptional activator